MTDQSRPPLLYVRPTNKDNRDPDWFLTAKPLLRMYEVTVKSYQGDALSVMVKKASTELYLKVPVVLCPEHERST